MAATDLTPKFVNSAKSVRFDSGAAVDAFFRERFRKGFVDWFNASIAGRGAWTVTFQGRTLPVMIGPPRGVTLDKLKERFTNFWDHAPELFGGPPTLVQFLSLMSIFINEVRGHLFSVTEAYGRPGHPGVAYLFDAIPGLKVSYNNPNPARPDNIAAGDLFHDPAFIAAHQARPLGAKLARTANRKAWNGADYALTGERASGPDVEAGFIAPADFMKFRGRGLIQTTWRSNYRKLVNFVARYEGKTPLLKDFAARWGGKDADRVLTESTNQEWDALFGDPALEVVFEAIRQHSAANAGYLTLADSAEGLNFIAQNDAQLRQAKGAIWHMGRRISGSGTYGRTFRGRVVELCNALGNGA
jgi:hypothetical protein